MANRFKEDEKNERIIRGLLKLPDNRRCINCNSLGPQYVCINFSTFICTTCSGIHREFTHRVKSVSMAKFTSQEVSALQGGGNASAKEIYLKELDPQRNSLPDGSNVERLCDFIKHVYVDRRYTGERGVPRGKGETEDLNGNRRVDTYQGSSQSSGGRSPGYDQDNRQYSDYKRSPSGEVINDWRREDRFGNGRRLEESRISDGGSKVEVKSPDRRSDMDTPSPPMVRPVRDILGENVSPLRVIEPPKANSIRPIDAPVQTQRTASSTSLASSNGNPAETKTETSLIDFEAVPEPPPTATVQQTQQLATAIPVSQPTPSGADNWANFESVSVKAPSNTNPLDVLSELMAPAPPTSIHLGGSPASAAPVGTLPASSSSPIPAAVPPLSSFGPTAFPPGGVSAAASGPASLLQVPFTHVTGAQWSSMQPQHPGSQPLPGNQPQHATSAAFPGTGSPSLPHHSIPVVGGPSGNQPWNPVAAPGLVNTANAQGPQIVTERALEATSGIASIAGGRKELPADLFTATYPPMYAPMQGWYAAPPHGIGFSMQYNMQVQTPTLVQPIKSSNPFDATSEPSALQASTFPSMASLQGALPNMGAPTGLHRTSSLGTPTPQPYRMPQQPPSYVSTLPPNAYMGQNLAGSMPQRPRDQALGFGLDGAAFGAMHTSQQLGGLHAAPAAQNTFSPPAGNPFG
nr:probable ADP-ribosylation factor GTPase-activating protein AGD14 [Ipomoea batatas]